jgi:hypothetical protein
MILPNDLLYRRFVIEERLEQRTLSIEKAKALTTGRFATFPEDYVLGIAGLTYNVEINSITQRLDIQFQKTQKTVDSVIFNLHGEGYGGDVMCWLPRGRVNKMTITPIRKYQLHHGRYIQLDSIVGDISINDKDVRCGFVNDYKDGIPHLVLEEIQELRLHGKNVGNVKWLVIRINRRGDVVNAVCSHQTENIWHIIKIIDTDWRPPLIHGQREIRMFGHIESMESTTKQMTNSLK